jgi:hypothetical protein
MASEARIAFFLLTIYIINRIYSVLLGDTRVGRNPHGVWGNRPTLFCLISIALREARIYAREAKCTVQGRRQHLLERDGFGTMGAGEPSSGSQYSNAREERRAICGCRLTPPSRMNPPLHLVDATFIALTIRKAIVSSDDVSRLFNRKQKCDNSS